MQEDKNLLRVFQTTHEYTTVTIDKNHPNPEQYVRDLISSNQLQFNDSETQLVVLPEPKFYLNQGKENY